MRENRASLDPFAIEPLPWWGILLGFVLVAAIIVVPPFVWYLFQ